MSKQLNHKNITQKILNKLGLRQDFSDFTVYGESEVVKLEPYKALYFPIPKVANSSLTIVCAKLLKIDVPENKMSARGILPYIKLNQVGQYQDYWKFCFVRNPWDRLVSCFSEKIKDNENYNLEGHFVNGICQGFLRYGKTFKANMPFEEFVQAVIQIPDAQADVHFRSQFTFVANESGKPVVDFVGKLESINEDFSQVVHKFGVDDIKLPHKLKNTHEKYRSYYTPKLQEKVAKRYAKDCELFKYEF